MNSLNENQNNEIHPEKIGGFLGQDKKDGQPEKKDVFSTDNKRTGGRKIIIGLAGFLLLAVAGLAGYSYYQGQSSFNAGEAEVVVLGPREIMSGEKINYQIKYTNRAGVDLKNSRILLSVPEKFDLVSSDKDFKKEPSTITWDLGELKSQETGIIEAAAKIVGSQDSEYVLDAKMLYTPANFNSEFQSAGENSKIKIKITETPFKLSLLSSESVIGGGEIETAVKYENISQTGFDKMGIKIIFPEGFVFSSSNPPPLENKNNTAYWLFEKFAPGESGKIAAFGNLNGEKGEVKEITAFLSAAEGEGDLSAEYLKVKSEIVIVEAPLVISQTVNGLTDYAARKNEELEYKIKYQNISDQEIKGLVINNILEGRNTLDFDSLKVTDGSYDDQYKITWSAFNVPELALLKPGQEGEVSFKIKLKDYFDIGSYDDKDFTIKSATSVKSFNFSGGAISVGKTIAANELATPVSGGLFLKTAGYYNDDGRIENEGSLPPTVGETTSYTVHWYLNSVASDIDKIKVAAVLPERTEWTGKYILNNRVFNEESAAEPSKNGAGEETLAYNSETREVTWNIPLLPANTGIISPVKEAVFQVALTPSVEDVGKIMTLAGEPLMAAHDKFTNIDLNGEGAAVTTELLDDESVGEEEGVVVSHW